MKKVHTNKGFTMAELLIVVAIIAIMVAIAIPTFGTQLERAREGVDLSECRNAYADAMSYFLTDKANVTEADYVKTISFKQLVSGWTINPEFPCDGITSVFGSSTLPGAIKLKFSKATDTNGQITVTVAAGAAGDTDTIPSASTRTKVTGTVIGSNVTFSITAPDDVGGTPGYTATSVSFEGTTGTIATTNVTGYGDAESGTKVTMDIDITYTKSGSGTGTIKITLEVTKA